MPLNSPRPTLHSPRSENPLGTFVQELQDAIDTSDGVQFNRHFAQDVLWGSPFGAVAVGYDQIHAIHAKMFGSVVPVKGASRYVIEHVSQPTPDVTLGYVRRVSNRPSAAVEPGNPGAFDELALLVLVQRDGQWWLAAAQHVPDRRDLYAKPVPK